MNDRPPHYQPNVSRRGAHTPGQPHSLGWAVAGLALIAVAIMIWRQSGGSTSAGAASERVMQAAQVDTGAQAATADANRVADPVVLSETEDAGAAPRADAIAAAGPALATGSAGMDEVLPMVRKHFPAQYDSPQFHRLWLVHDGHGQVLVSGELEEGQRYEDAEEQLRGLQGQTPGDWQVRQLRNGAGQLIEVAVAQANMGEPRR